MLLRPALLVVALALASSAAWAGDPCPIEFRLVNLGPNDFPWVQKPIAVKDDEVYQRLVAHLKSAECTEVTSIDVADDGYLKLGKEPKSWLRVWRIREQLLKGKDFRCDDAHTGLAALGALGDGGVVFYQRGTRRVLLTTAGWDTVCVPVDELKTKADVAKLWEKGTHRYVADRHANP